MSQCTATSKRTRERCRARAVTGKRVCYHHGGAPGTGRGGVKHNLWSETLAHDPELLKAYEYFKSNPNMCDMSPEIAMASAYFAQYLKARPAGAPISADYVQVVGEYVEKLSRLKEKEHKRRHGEHITITMDTVAAICDDLQRWLVVRKGRQIDSRLLRDLADHIGKVLGPEGREQAQ